MTFAQFFQQQKTLFFALLAGQILMAAMLYFFVEKVSPGNETLAIVGVAVYVVASFAGTVVGNKILANAKTLPNIGERLNEWRKAQILRMALREGGVLVNLVLYFFATGNSLNAIVAGIGIGVFSLLMPSIGRIVREVDLGSGDLERLDTGEILIPG